MKSYTDLEQSKKLAEILPIESADMCYLPTHIGDEHHFIASLSPYSMCTKMTDVSIEYCTPCWSLAALLAVIPYNVTFNKAVYRFKLVKFSDRWECYHENFGSVSTGIFKADNPIDACYEMIIKLKERDLL